jgi:hypothetical protein
MKITCILTQILIFKNINTKNNKMTTDEKCDYLFKNILITFDKYNCGNYGCASYIRELQETTRCDHIHDMKSSRNKIKTEINMDDPARYNRILSYKNTSDDNEISLDVLNNYGYMIDNELLKGLKIRSIIEYNIHLIELKLTSKK